MKKIPFMSAFPSKQALKARALLCCTALVACLSSPPSGGAAEVPVQCNVIYRTADRVYVDAGTDVGLASGDAGIVRRDGIEVARVEVLRATKSSSLLQVTVGRDETTPRVGDTVHFVVEETPPAEKPDPRERSPTLKDPDSKPFVPLLAPPEGRSVRATPKENIFHGRLWVRQLLQVEEDELRDYSITRLGTVGSLERIGGTPWTLEWSGDVSYRDGHALRNSEDYRDVVPRVFGLSFVRRFEDESMLRLGRFLPLELPGVGYLDGAQGEMVVNDTLRVGAMFGLKPTRDRLDLSGKEPTLVTYGTVEAGDPGDLYYSGTLGLLGSLYEGEADRLAVLFDQAAHLGPRFSLHSTSEVDFDIGGAETRNGASLTRLNLFGAFVATSFLTLRAGVDHFERPDTQAERDLLPFQDDRFFDHGHWRYYVGGSQKLPWKLYLSEQVAFSESETEDLAILWRVTLSRIGLPLLPGARTSLTVYNLDGLGSEGYGGRFTAHLPLMERRLYLEPSVAFRLLDTNLDGDELEFTSLSLRAHSGITRFWSVHGGFSYSFDSLIDVFLIDLGTTLRW